MTNKLAGRIRSISGIALSMSIFAAGICLCASCIGIYQTGDHPFSREVVAEAFSGIAFPVYLCLTLAAATLILDLILPDHPVKQKTGKQNAMVLKRLYSKVDLSQCDPALRAAVSAQKNSRKLHRCITAALLILGSVIFLVYAFAEGSFHQNQINDSMIRAMGVLLTCMAVPFGYCVFTVYHNDASMVREISLLKQADTKKIPVAHSPAPGSNRVILIRNVILAVAIACLVFGFLTGGTADVLTKAVNICTECVGLG